MLSNAIVRLRVHLDALYRTPGAYAVAAWWRLCGKRVRARAQFAPLLAASPASYKLWLLREEQAERSCTGAPIIVALVSATPGDQSVSITLQSLCEEGIPALVITQSPEFDAATVGAFIASTEASWVMPLMAGDVVAPGTATAYRTTALASPPGSHLLYADDDLIGANGRRSAPHFKPDWNAELFRHFDYVTGACIIHARLAKRRQVGHRWAADLVALAIAAPGPPPVHVRNILHHRIARPEPRVPVKADTHRYDATLPTVTVIIPTRNRIDLLRTCLDGLAVTDYPDLEIIVVDNGSDDPETLAYIGSLDPSRYRVEHAPGPFNFSALNNRAAKIASGHLLCLLNNDIEVTMADWLTILAVQAMRDDVGAVGPQLLYPDGRIQHAGVVIGVGGGAAHAHRLLSPDEDGYFKRHALPQYVSAVTAACLVVKAERFAEVGGLDEVRFPVAFNDVDLCMRLNRQGWQSLYEPRAKMIHHESVSRGFDRDPVGAKRLTRELAALNDAWQTEHTVDPFHHPRLSKASERFVVQL